MGGTILKIAKKIYTEVAASGIDYFSSKDITTAASGQIHEKAADGIVFGKAEESPLLKMAIVRDAYFAVKKYEKIYDEKKTISNHTAIKGDYLGTIAKKLGVSVKELKKQNNLTSDGVAIGQKFQVTKIKKNEKGQKVVFERKNFANVGEEIYVIVQTSGLVGKTIHSYIMQGKEKGIVEKSKALNVLFNDKEDSIISAIVGDYKDEKEILNKTDFKDWAIAKVKLQSKEEEKTKKWVNLLDKLIGKKTYLYLLINAHVDKEDFDIEYYGFKEDGKEQDQGGFNNCWLDREGSWFKLASKRKLNLNAKGFSTNNNITIDHISALEKGRPTMKDKKVALILHRTVSGNYPGSWMKLKTKIKGAHFYVDKDGTVYQTASLNISVAHIYASSSKQMYPKYFGKLQNSNTIGIEVVGNYINGKWEPLTKKQIEATTLLIAQIKGEYDLTNTKIYPHEKVQRKTKGEGKTVFDAVDLNFN